MNTNERVKVELVNSGTGRNVQVKIPISILVMSYLGKNDGLIHKINSKNFNQVLSSISPTLKLEVSGAEQEIIIKSIDDFNPYNVARQSTKICKLIGLRNLICVLNNRVKNKDINFQKQGVMNGGI